MKKLIHKNLAYTFGLLALMISLSPQARGNGGVSITEITCDGQTFTWEFVKSIRDYCNGDIQCLCDRRHLGKRFYGGLPGGRSIPPTAPTAPGNKEPSQRQNMSQFFSWFTLAVAAVTMMLLGRRWWRGRGFSLPARVRALLRQPAFSGVAVVSLVAGIGSLMLLFPTLSPAGKRGKVSAREQAQHKPFQKGRSATAAQKAAQRALAQSAVNPSPADQFTSAFSMGGNGITQIGAAGYDANGNLYVTGGFQGTLELIVNAQNVILTATRDMDFFLAKFDPNNQCLWVRTASGATNLPSGVAIEGAIALTVDGQGNCYVGGGFAGSLIFKDSQDATLAILSDNNNDVNIEPFVAKFSANGALAWAQGGNSGSVDGNGDAQYLLNNTNAVTEIVVDSAGNPYVAGLTSGERFLGTAFQGRGASDIVIARLQPTNGNVTWLQSAGGSSDDGALGLAIDKAANVYLIGYFNDIVRFPTQPASFYDSLGYEDTFVSKFDANGQCVWVKQIGGEFDIVGNSIAVDEDSNLYLTGSYFGEANFGATKFDSPDYIASFLVKMNADCQYLWARSSGGTADTYGDRVTLDRQGQVFVLGTFENYDEEDFATALFGEETLANPVGIQTEDGDLFLAKYTRDGAFRWARGVYGTGSMAGCAVCTDGVSLGYLPLRLVKNPATNDLQLFGDFQGTLTLSDNNLTSDLTSPARVGFAAKLMHNCASLAFSNLPGARVNEAYNAKINLVSGDNPAQFAAESAAALPPGLTLAADGTLSGTPTKPGVYTVKVNGSDAYDCSGSNTYQITVSTYEGDVAPRSEGNGAVSIADWTQIGRFVVGLDTVQASEFQRADVAPRAAQGDGKLTIGDWVQAGRYAAGLDTNIYAAGPTIASLSAAFANRAMSAPHLSLQSNRLVRAVQASDEANTVVIQLDSLGDENAVGLSLAFDPTVIRFVGASLENGLASGALLLNDRAVTQGSIGLLASLPVGQRLTAGTRQLLKLRFEPVSSRATAWLRFAEAATADATANALPTTAVNVELALQSRMTRPTSRGGRRTTGR